MGDTPRHRTAFNRERLPVVPILVSTTGRRREATGLLQAPGDTEPAVPMPSSDGVLEFTHHSISQYWLPATGEVVPNPPMPLLFQRRSSCERRAFTPTAIRKLLTDALASTGPANAEGGLPASLSPTIENRFTESCLTRPAEHDQVPPGLRVPSAAFRRGGPDPRCPP
ncbi:hypothetical protein GCM10010276_21790 [Streptomyces longisporus]|uniref:Uncharacterized protein n=1 Tax=Streptomyces longisporus TaxID=1948 RepID=A0ABN3LK45_STRLO